MPEIEKEIKELIDTHTCDLIECNRCCGNGCSDCDGVGMICGKDLVDEYRRLALAKKIKNLFKTELEKKEKEINNTTERLPEQIKEDKMKCDVYIESEAEKNLRISLKHSRDKYNAMRKIEDNLRGKITRLQSENEGLKKLNEERLRYEKEVNEIHSREEMIKKQGKWKEYCEFIKMAMDNED